MIQRFLMQKISNYLHKGKAILLLGGRQIGKTTLLQQLFPENDDIIWLNGDELDVQAMFANTSADRLKNNFSGKKIVVIDEAQRISDIGLRMKLITDQIKDIQLIATGSSAFELSNAANEPLTGRKWEFKMYPLSFAEMVGHHGLLKEKRLLPQRLVYGYYPEVVSSEGNERKILKYLTDSYLYKDILTFNKIKKSDALIKLLQALAYQVGSQVSYNELSQIVGIDAKTVEIYIQLLEQCYIIFRLPSFSRNMRNELKNSKKIYFYDNGIRNALISNFSPIEIRTDTGALWENFIISERMKFTEYNDIWSNRYFWRTKEQHEIDYVEDRDGTLYAYEFKFNPKKKAKIPNSFVQNYPLSVFAEITPENIEDFILL
ncbi:MAG: ATP-binding protein [bacterium]|nr:ATP-binding protein [Candidatus Limimorpha equi]